MIGIGLRLLGIIGLQEKSSLTKVSGGVIVRLQETMIRATKGKSTARYLLSTFISASLLSSFLTGLLCTWPYMTDIELTLPESPPFS